MRLRFSTPAGKKSILALLLFTFVIMTTKANPGDTTWVTVWNLRKLTQHGNYDTVAVFPTNKQYRKIRLHYILGRYACPPNTQYCGSWDYTTMIHARPAGKDSVEIARIITPYATDWLQQNKKHDYVVEVTDYASVLDGSTAMRFRYEGYSWGFTITLKIEFIEGTPPMDALQVKNIYDGYFPYGNSANPIENYLVPKTFTYTSPATRLFVKNSVSGHGSDNFGCGEFCSKWYQLKLNNNNIAQQQLWRADCGLNHVYPQTGTWIYNRSNWCPGAVVWPIYHDLKGLVTANTVFTVNVDMQPYSIASPSGGYNFVSQLIHYGPPNHVRDVSIEDIAAPTNNENYFRNNPRCSNPLITIRNTGTDTVKNVVFEYGMKGETPATYTWTGALPFLATTEAVFPPSASVLTYSVSKTFTVKILSVNDISSDDNIWNNTYQSVTKAVSVFPKSFVVKHFTNNNAFENTWTIYDEFDNVIATRNMMAPATLYADTILDLTPGCYRISIDDTGCDGLSWWANPGQGSGYLRLDYVNANNSIFMSPTDFGCNYTKYFSVAAPSPPPVDTTSVAEGQALTDAVDVFPNPVSNVAYLRIDINQRQEISYTITDLSGRTLAEEQLGPVMAGYHSIETGALGNGVYLMNVRFANGSVVSKKMVIQK